MCRAVTCRKCQKITWAGCGQHVDQVMSHVLRAERCTCDKNTPESPAKSTNWLARLFGR